MFAAGDGHDTIGDFWESDTIRLDGVTGYPVGSRGWSSSRTAAEPTGSCSTRSPETDTIHDFEDGQDIIVIKGGLKFSDLNINQRGNDAVISGLSGTRSIVLEDF